MLGRLGLLSLLLFAASGVRFSLESAPGVSDIGHLGALSLPFGRLLGWLLGAAEPSLVPAPPASAPLPILLDWLIWRVNPFGLAGLRIAHVAMATGAIALLIHALKLRIDMRAAALAAVVIALSPRFVAAVTSLGATPYIFALFCWQLSILLTRGKIGGPEPLLLLTGLAAATGLCGPAAMPAVATLFAMLLLSAPDRSELLRRCGYAACAVLAWTWPLVMQIRLGEPVDPFSKQGVVSLLIKLVAHNADLVILPGGLILAAGTALLILLGSLAFLDRLRRNGMAERGSPFGLLLIGNGCGLAFVLLAGPSLRLYPWTEYANQSWLSLLVVLLAAACFTPRLLASEGISRRFRQLGAGLMLIGALSGILSYHLRAEWFAAGPEAGLQRALTLASNSRAVVYTGADWGRTYFPHAWLNPDDNDQWLLTLDATAVQRVSPGGRLSEPQPLAVLNGYTTIVLARIERHGWRDMRAVAGSGLIGAMPPASISEFSTAWRPEPPQASPGEQWLTTQILRNGMSF